MSNNNIEQYNKSFVESLGVDQTKITSDLAYNSIPEWDSIAHMTLVASLEEIFNISLETDDIIDFSSYKKGIEILKKYKIDVTTICPGYIKSEMTDVNEFKMPFLMDTDVAAKKMIKAIEGGKKTYILPWQWRPIIALSRLFGQKLSKI